MLQFRSGDTVLDRAFHIALGDCLGNVHPWRGEDDPEPRPCLLAGLDYDSPWTRDAALNTWYAGTYLMPETARSTLESVLVTRDGERRIGGEYWDAVIWVTAAWQYYLFSGARDFLAPARDAAVNTVMFMERTEYDAADGLFRGGACFQDGVSGYPDFFADGPTSGIADWVRAHPGERVPAGHGLPIKALSTNALYFSAYQTLALMDAALGIGEPKRWSEKAARLKDAVQKRFWMPDRGWFRYLVDAQDNRDRQEGFGHAFALLFDLASPEQAASVIGCQHITPHGIPCVWPGYERYKGPDGICLGRHSGTIWPQVNAAWVMALVKAGRRDLAWIETRLLAEKACRDHQFAELYHPVTGLPIGGLQESYTGGPIMEWPACSRQTWCATGFIGMMTALLLGMKADTGGLSFAPWLPEGMDRIRLDGIRYRGAVINVNVVRGAQPCVHIDGEESASARIGADAAGHLALDVTLAG